jgi:hypothetical protein
VAIFIWAGWAFAGAAVTGLLWNATSRRLTVLPGIVPRVIAFVAMAAAGVMLWRDDQLPILAAVACAAAMGLLATGLTRWAAGPALAVALPGLATIFVSHVVSKADVGWQQTTAVLGFGLAAVAALMILIEPRGERCESSSSGPDAAGG